MKRTLWAFVIVAVIVGGGWLTFRDPGRIHIYSADGQVLAETELESWCSGSTYWASSGRGNAQKAADCRKTYGETLDTVIDHNNVPLWFCLGAQSEGFQGDVILDCVDFIVDIRWWPTMNGMLAEAWSDSYPTRWTYSAIDKVTTRKIASTLAADSQGRTDGDSITSGHPRGDGLDWPHHRGTRRQPRCCNGG